MTAVTDGGDGPLLAVIDMQRIFAAGPWGAPRFAEVLDPVRTLVGWAGRTLFTRFVAPARPEGAWRAYYDVWPFALDPAHAAEYALVDDFAGHAGRTVDAPVFGKWPALRERAGAAPGTRLVVCGVSTDCCVLSTVLAAADDGMRVQVVADACAGVDDASHARALEVMALYTPLVEVVRLADLVAPAAPGR